MVNEIVHPRIGVAAAELVAECLGRGGRFGSLECDYHGLVEDHTRGTVAYLNAESSMSNSRRSNVIGALRVFFGEFCDREVMEAFTLPSSQTKPTEVPSREGLNTFYQAIENPKYELLFLFAATSGSRSGELLALTMDDINEVKRMIVPEKESSTKQMGRVKFGVNCGRRRRLRASFELSLARHC